MPSLSAPVTPSEISGKLDFESNISPLTRALDRTLQVKCMRMQSFIDNHRHELHLHVNTLRQFASSSGGLVLDEIRSVVWPILASSLIADFASDHGSSSESGFESAVSQFSDEEDTPSSSKTVIFTPSLNDLMRHGEWNQVELDVKRTLSRFPPNISDSDRVHLQKELTPLIIRILWTCPHFHYYQGFHDVCLTLLLVLGVQAAESVGVNLAKNGIFNEYLLRTLEDTVLRDLDLMYIILWKVDSEIERIMRSVQLGSLFALSWPLTWFSHAFHHYRQVVLCFDLFLASHPLMPIYFSSAVVLWRSSSILSSSYEMPILHHLLNIMPDEVPVRALAADAQDLFRMLPPSLLRGRLSKDYCKLLKETHMRKPSLPTTSLKAWLVAGTATAAVYMLSRYLFITS
ncbi:unnamed protein product [Dracunculus medinensis]|uniref:Rab-GAP TBC domain-containing protein n=1 Tax=Dracunculus medinensis TaxID=318479 RepID=A0A0N4UMP7_DRAME|nr:unnamed protein product [Dracunculus medinensis]